MRPHSIDSKKRPFESEFDCSSGLRLATEMHEVASKVHRIASCGNGVKRSDLEVFAKYLC
jgi:hypothetical protein